MTHLLSFIDPSPQLAPSQPLNPPTPAQTPERLKSINTAHKSALLVANHPFLVEFLRRFFEGEDYTIRTASNGEEGMRLYGDCGPFNVVLIDYDVPQRNGFEIDYSVFQLRTLLATLEVRRAMAALTDSDKRRLQRSAAYRIRGLGRAARNRTADDLLGEAQLWTFIGAGSTESRHWKR